MNELISSLNESMKILMLMGGVLIAWVTIECLVISFNYWRKNG